MFVMESIIINHFFFNLQIINQFTQAFKLDFAVFLSQFNAQISLYNKQFYYLYIFPVLIIFILQFQFRGKVYQRLKLKLQYNIICREIQAMNAKNRMRWENQLKQCKKQEQQNKDFEIMDYQSAIETCIAIVLVHGPPSSPYQGYSFKLQYNGQDIPFQPPKVRFLDIPWSPFVCPKTGMICCDILKNPKNSQKSSWSPALTIKTAILSIISILSETVIPANESGLNLQASADLRLKYSVFFQNARQKAQKYHHVKKNMYKDEEKPYFPFPQDLKKQDDQYMMERDNFFNDPQVKQNYRKKIQQISSKPIDHK